jgi:hypothetical protein
MANVDTGSSAHKQVVHTESHAPAEAIFGRIVYYVLGVIEVLLGLRFVLRMLGANAQSAFVQFIYSVSAIFMAPFTAVFKTTVAEGAKLEWSILVAMAVYALIAWGIVALIGAINPRRSSETVERVEQSEDTAARR